MKPNPRPISDDVPPNDEPEAAPQPCRPAPWWVRVFVPFHILAITIYALPLVAASHLVNGKPRPGLNSDWLLYWNETGEYVGKRSPPIYAYLMTTGFWQYWDMFAPDPVQGDVYGSAKIIYADGSVRDYQYPRMFLESIPQKYIDERYRKFFERVHDANKAFVSLRVAQRIALLNDDNPANPPVEVKLYIHEWDIPKPGNPIHPQYNSTEFFDYFVDQQLLAKDKDGAS